MHELWREDGFSSLSDIKHRVSHRQHNTTSVIHTVDSSEILVSFYLAFPFKLGLYECQISTTPVRSYVLRLSVAGEIQFGANIF